MTNAFLYDATVAYGIGLQETLRRVQRQLEGVMSLFDQSALVSASVLDLRTRRQITQALNDVAKTRRAMFVDIDATIRPHLIRVGEGAARRLAMDMKIDTPPVDVDRYLRTVPLVGTLYSEWLKAAEMQDHSRIRAELRIAFAQQRPVQLGSTIKRTHNSAQTLVMTAGNMVANEARHEVIKSSGVTQWRYTSLLDRSTSNRCLAADGTVYNVNEGPRAPLHLNCRALPVPVLAGGGDFPPNESLEGWLKRRSQP